jgi:hypothetical protein
VAEHHAGRRGRAAADHVLVGTADIRGYDLENDAVVDRLSGRIAKARKVDLLNFDAAGFEVHHATIGIRRHLQSPFGSHAELSCEWRSFGRPRGASASDRPNPASDGWLEDIDLQENDFGRLAAIRPALR